MRGRRAMSGYGSEPDFDIPMRNVGYGPIVLKKSVEGAGEQ